MYNQIVLKACNNILAITIPTMYMVGSNSRKVQQDINSVVIGQATVSCIEKEK